MFCFIMRTMKSKVDALAKMNEIQARFYIMNLTALQIEKLYKYVLNRRDQTSKNILALLQVL